MIKGIESMKPQIETLAEKKLVGQRVQMSLVNNQTQALWQGFMSRRKEVTNTVGTDFYSMQIYDPSYFMNFSPTNSFEKWATVEVSDFNDIPEGMESIILPGGLYAVFLYKGLPAEAGKLFQYIFGVWIPASEYELDGRPHFEVLGEKYKNDSPDSEEEIWIPVRPKAVP